MTGKTISVVTPIYNEGEQVYTCYEQVAKVFQEHLPEYTLEHIFCDNASTDGVTETCLRDLAAKHSNCKVIFNRRNFGVLRNTYNGVMATTGDAVVLFMPADLQDPPELLPDFVKAWEDGFEVVYGVRAKREENWLMMAARKLYYRALSWITHNDYPPDVGDFQLVDQRVIEEYRALDDKQPFLRVMPFEMGFRCKAVEYTWRKRTSGKSRLNLLHLVDMGLYGMVSHSTVPLRLAFAVGLLLAVPAMVYALGMLVAKILYWDSIQPGFTVLITGVYFFAGVQLVFLGMLGEYVSAVLAQVRGRKLVYERERLNFD